MSLIFAFGVLKTAALQKQIVHFTKSWQIGDRHTISRSSFAKNNPFPEY
jgi:hypothetical protein